MYLSMISKKIKKISIIGGAGLLGKEYLKYSKDIREKIVFDKKNPKLQNLKVKYFKFNSLNKKSFNNEINNSEIIIFMAGKVGGPESLELNKFNDYFETNCNSLQIFLKNLRIKNLKKIIFFSTEHVYEDNSKICKSFATDPNPKNYYGVTKLIGEKLLYKFHSESNVSIDILRFPRVITLTKKSLISSIKNKITQKKIIKIHNNRIKFNFIYIKDLIDAIDCCTKKIKTDFRILNIFNNDKAISIKDIINLIEKKINKKAKKIKIFKNIKKDHNPMVYVVTKNKKLNKKFNWIAKFNNKKIVKEIIDNEIK